MTTSALTPTITLDRRLWVTAYQMPSYDVLLAQHPHADTEVAFTLEQHGNVRYVPPDEFQRAQASGRVTFYSIPNPF